MQAFRPPFALTLVMVVVALMLALDPLCPAAAVPVRDLDKVPELMDWLKSKPSAEWIKEKYHYLPSENADINEDLWRYARPCETSSARHDDGGSGAGCASKPHALTEEEWAEFNSEPWNSLHQSVAKLQVQVAKLESKLSAATLEFVGRKGITPKTAWQVNSQWQLARSLAHQYKAIYLDPNTLKPRRLLVDKATGWVFEEDELQNAYRANYDPLSPELLRRQTQHSNDPVHSEGTYGLLKALEINQDEAREQTELERLRDLLRKLDTLDAEFELDKSAAKVKAHEANHRSARVDDEE
ncbi:hypothetical protein ACQY0O_006472 [Thecaphora frezii]